MIVVTHHALTKISIVAEALAVVVIIHTALTLKAFG